ncbi:Vacuolar protein sorting-associated protein 13 [Psilocybe cubensis]|uniref:Vacuolar protein sorting-associated protein 13 n=1 Tax=Psilocybe cubensis TaxID=181762 RepID=A0ACB8HG67_PSICU|nr:Vacuolar protein sorting-associated protein 13 [Psilocybe cubensis]KAH9486936.1 Vacuolar protein sorting-associated protein 13 [Psilocybe cubensis]
MWWLDPGKELLNVLFNRILAPYVMNLDLNQVNYGIGQGQLTLRNLKLKKGALDKFQLPVDVLEGHLGKFTLSLHWMNLGNQPVEILVEDVYLLVVPSPQTSTDPEEDEARAQAAKSERLENAELLHVQSQAAGQSDDSTQSQGLVQSIIAKVINNVQVTVKNIHIRYEDNMSVPGHPFAAGLTLAGFTAVSVNSNWEAAFIESTAGAIHKLAKLQSLALYFDTDSPSMAGLPTVESIKKFSSMISHTDDDGQHQYILKPVSGEGRIIVNHKIDPQTPRFDIQLLFEEIGVILDDNQYRDAISLADMYHVYLRKRQQYGKYRPAETEFSKNPAKARLQYAATAILEGVRDKKRKWTWQYFAERRDDRNAYVALFQKKLLNPALIGPDLQSLQTLEKKMAYEDIRFYRSIARSKLKKDAALRKRLEAEKKQQQPQKQGWGAWLWGSSSNDTSQEDPTFGGPMTEEQRQQLYDVLDYDEKAALVDSLQASRDSLKMRVTAKLNKGSFGLKTDPHGKNTEVMSVVFDVFRANFIQRPNNFESSISLNSFRVFDGTTESSLYPQIVHVKTELVGMDNKAIAGEADTSNPFFFVKFENNPLDERADSALTVRMRHMEIIYHKGYVEAVYKFFKPPSSQLESVEALLNVASQTLEGLRRETRAGLEYALQTHKTVDIQMDLNAPIIIIPEDVTTNACRHLIIDAGHISIESDLVSKEAIHTIHQKRHQKYTDEDYKNLESLMYDKMSLRLQDAQFIIGDNLHSCRAALRSESHDTLHLLERITVDLQIEKSIVPTALNLAQFKVAGTLPSLQVNLSDAKYKSLMRLVDVCIPHFDENTDPSTLSPQSHSHTSTFPLPPTLFGQSENEYNVDDDDDNDEQHQESDSRTVMEEQFFEAEDGTSEHPELRQHIFELQFKVDKLRAAVSRSTADGIDKSLGNLDMEGFSLSFALTKYEMNVDINLSSVSMDVIQPSGQYMQFITTPELGPSIDKDLLRISYHRIQKESPDFMTIAEGIDQSVDIKMSTLVFQAAPEPVLDIYNFIMSTFVTDSQPVVQPSAEWQASGSNDEKAVVFAESEGKIRVLMKFEGIRVTLINESITLATLALSIADVAILVRPKTLRVSGRLGNLTLTNDNKKYAILGDFNQLVSIDGKNFADFRYQTFDPEEDHYTGVKSSVHLDAASIKFHFVEQPLHDLYLFFSKLAKLKGLYDAATQVAVQRASEIERMQFEVSIKSPIVVFPSNSTSSSDTLVLRLGQISARNTSEALVNRIFASLNGIQLASYLGQGDTNSSLKIIDDIDVSAEIIQTSNIDRNQDTAYPDTQVAVKISDVKLHLTQTQYCLLMQLATEIPRVFIGAPEVESETAESIPPSKIKKPEGASAGVDLQPELRSQSQQNWTTVDLVVSVNTVKLHLYDSHALSDDHLKEHGIARFALNDNTLRFKLLSHGAGEAQVVLRSFTMSNTRPGNNKFREIIPAAQHNRNQFMLLYTMSGGQDSSSLAVLTVDSPQVIFAIDPVISLLEFFTSTFNGSSSPSSPPDHVESQNDIQVAQEGQGGLEFRLDLHDVSVSILENDADPESRAIRLYINQILFSQQGIMALSVNRLGMSLMRMGRSAESVRFLDDVDLTFSVDSRSSSQQQMMNIELTSKPIVFRASYRDINLITSIVNKAIERYGNSQKSFASQKQDTIADGGSSSQTNRIATPSRKSDGTRPQPTGKARVLMSKEVLKGSFDGFRLVLIGDLHEHPMLHLKVKPFIIGAQDWSGQLHATTTMTTTITYWNLTNSHWEPLIDPWTLTITAAKDSPVGGIDLNLSARERLDLNISTTFVELALTTFNSWSQEGESLLQKPRGTYAPYRIRNQTGAPIFIWSDTDSTTNTKDVDVVKILHDQSIDWRFDDWKTMREFVEKSWEQLRGIPVDREGEFVFSLRPRTEKYPSRLLCEVKVVENTKIVTIRSTYKVENLTLYPIELMLVDDSGHPVYSLERIVPGTEFSLPIDAVTKNRVRLQPDQGLGYKWSAPIRWEDLISRKSFTIKCPHGDPREAAFRLQAWVHTDSTESSPLKYPKINLKLRAPLELENLLPYNLEYRIYDKNTNQNWKSYLRQGGIMPVHSVELGHFILLNVNLEESVFKPSEFTIINTDGHSDFDIENTLTLRDQYDRKLDLKLNYVRHPDSGGAFKVQIYTPYIIVNKSGLPFAVKSTRSNRTGSQDVAGDTRPDVLSKPIPFLLSHTNKHGHEFMFKISDSLWSKPISLEAPSAETELVVASQRQKADEYHIGLSWSEGLGKYKLSKVVTLTPRFLIKNQLPDSIAFRQHGASPRDRSLAEPGQKCAFQVLRSGDEKLLTIAYPGLNARWSPPINIEDIGSVHFRLPRLGDAGGHDLVRADIRIEGSTIFIFISLASGGPPFVIENDSDYDISFSQQDAGRDQQLREPLRYIANAHSAIPYAWDFPAARDKKILLAIGSARRMVDILEIGDLMPFKFNDQQRVRAVSLDVRADGEKQILRITNYNPDRSLYRPRQRNNSLSVSRQDTISSSAEAFEAITEEVSSDLTVVIDLAGVGISLINKRMVEVVYMVMDTIKFEYANSSVAQSVNLACGTLQIDNQLHEAIFPVILQPTPIAKESAGIGALPTVQASVIWLKDQAHGVLFIKYCSILLQALTIEADEDLLFAIYDLTQIKGASWEQGTVDVLLQNINSIPEPSTQTVGQDLYFEILELQPIKLSLSFMRTERVNSEEKLSIRNPLAVVVNALTMTVGNINDAPLELNALAIKDMRLTMPELQSRIMYHYRQDVLRQLYRILGSADFIGNPIGLFTNVSSGVADIFYEPFQGVIVHGNKELGIGIAKGAASFVKKTVFGVSDSFTKFTSSVGKGLSAATFDSEYQARRRMTQRRNKPRHAIYGVAAGGEAFASSVTSAMEGVFMKPLEGAESEGALGFFKGVGKGLVGAVTKPVVGVFDLASNVSEGIRNTTTVFDNPERDRMRLPRLVPSDGVLRPYSSREALGQSWMKDLNDGAYRREFYVAHINSPGADNVILLTASRVLSFWSKKLRLEWELPFTQIQGVTVEDTGIRFAHKAGKEQDKFAFIPDKASQSWFFNQVASVVKSFNARRRMDG